MSLTMIILIKLTHLFINMLSINCIIPVIILALTDIKCELSSSYNTAFTLSNLFLDKLQEICNISLKLENNNNFFETLMRVGYERPRSQEGAWKTKSFTPIHGPTPKLWDIISILQRAIHEIPTRRRPLP